jgi:hypothetical protein
MKNIFFTLIIGLLLLQCKDKTEPTSEITQEKTVLNSRKNVVGGWATSEVTPLIKELAKFVKKEKEIDASIKEISNVSTQVVSGKNYRFEMTLENREHWMVQVYVNLQNERTITAFKKQLK